MAFLLVLPKVDALCKSFSRKSIILSKVSIASIATFTIPFRKNSSHSGIFPFLYSSEPHDG